MNALLTYAKLLKFLCHFSGAEALKLTLLRAASRLLLLQPLFLGLLLAHACAFSLGFGHDVYAFREVGHAFVSLFRLLLGDVDLAPLLQTNPYLALFLCLSLALSVYLALTSMFLAILSETYVRVRTAREHRDTPASLGALRDYASVKGEVALVAYQDLKYGIGWLRNVYRLGFDFDTAAWREVGEAAQRARLRPTGPRRNRSRSEIKRAPAVAAAAAEEETQDPETWREKMIEQLGSEDAAVQRTAMMTDQLKAMYLQLCSGQQETMDLVERVAAAVSAVQHENALILGELQAKGIEFNLDAAAFQRMNLRKMLVTNRPGV